MQSENKNSYDIALIGAGIMSATLATLLSELDPSLKILILERLDRVAAESSSAWNNAGTGHSAFCELNYTSMDSEGNIDISKAIKIAHSFEVSKQFWAYLRQQKYFAKSELKFIHKIPHISFVWNNANCDFLTKRYEALKSHVYFENMEISDDPNIIKQWIPLVMNGRNPDQKINATQVNDGTDVNFGELTKSMIEHLEQKKKIQLYLGSDIQGLEKQNDSRWKISYCKNDEMNSCLANFVFIGAGGGTLKLLDMADLPEAKGYGGFPISGQFLKCTNPKVISQHRAKVYGKAAFGAPPMSVPHLDTRYIDGKKELLFGPYAGFSTKFLKHGSYFDLPLSIEMDNIKSMIGAGIHNVPLTKYLIEQVVQSHSDRIESLREYCPNARENEWELITAGQRVQVIKSDEEDGGVLEFGTEVIHAQDGSMAALLGASPGASTAVSIMLDIIDKCFIQNGKKINWKMQIETFLPLHHHAEDEKYIKQQMRITEQILFPN